MRMHFTPPLVLPAHEPHTMHMVKTTHVRWGQSPASVLKRPVVVMKDDTWNKAYLNESATCMPPCVVNIKVMNSVDASIIDK